MSGLELRYGSIKNAACRRQVVSRGCIHCRACAPCMLVYFRQKAGTLNIQFRSCIKKKKNLSTVALQLGGCTLFHIMHYQRVGCFSIHYFHECLPH